VHVIHSDHLNTPRALANAQTQGRQAAGTVVWRWKLNQQTATGSNAFGAQPADEDPDGNGTRLRFDLRFPGQQYDAATGLHYNYFRDYEPGTGRYVESDPIGLGGVD
jgi:RHS repeat-associated protein